MFRSDHLVGPLNAGRVRYNTLTPFPLLPGARFKKKSALHLKSFFRYPVFSVLYWKAVKESIVKYVYRSRPTEVGMIPCTDTEKSLNIYQPNVNG
jgi:hypothetical protein